MMAEGTVKLIYLDKGFGFIITEDDSEYFFHSTMVVDRRFDTLKIGDKVYFDPRPSKRYADKMDANNVVSVQTHLQNPSAQGGMEVENQRLAQQRPARVAGGVERLRSPQPLRESHSPSSKSPLLPYGFVPINVDAAITDTPVWHDGSCRDLEAENGELLSGELCCTLTALTPLLAGNARYPVRKDGDANGEYLASADLLRQWGFVNLKPGKQIAEPLRLPDGRVVIPGSALKGMIRHSLGALLSAPMERVGERHYTYRPTLDFNFGGIPEKFVCRPALVVAKAGEGWKVEVFDDARAANFIRENAEGAITKAKMANNELVGFVNGIRINRNRVERDDRNREALNHRLAIYKGGIDGEGLLAETAQVQAFTYRYALVPIDKECTLEISPDLYQRYLHDQITILADSDTGHLTAHPHNNLDARKVSTAIKRNSKLEINQLIYVELLTVNGRVAGNSRIVSFGHHFRYRWAYSSSVRKTNGELRKGLNPKDCELVPADRKNENNVPPKELTGARLLFGYVKQDDVSPIGKGVYERLAGRIAINHAISQSDPEYLGDPKKGYCLPLPILGQPKSSSWEFYLRQLPNKPPSTYGDLPDDAGGELAGRKFYRHQPSVQGVSDISVTDDEIIKSDQATLARYICKPGTEFRFAIRFSGLRSWELGALLVTLQPHRLLKKGRANDYAQKLGLGRPLGMGSVRLNIDAAAVRSKGTSQLQAVNDVEELVRDAVQSLARRLLGNTKAGPELRLWMDIHSYKDLGKFDYPRGGNNWTIFDWHTKLRRDYSKLRRQAKPTWKPFLDTINERVAFPSYHAEDDFIDGGGGAWDVAAPAQDDCEAN